MINKERQCTQSRQPLAQPCMQATIGPPFPLRAALNLTPLLAAQALCFQRQGQAVFGPLHFTLAAGQLLQACGGNGAGKTSLLRVLAGLSQPSSGQVHFDGQPANNDARTRYVAYLGHLAAIKAELGCLHNLQAACGLLGRRARQTPQGALTIVGLSGLEHVPAGSLSAGQRRRLALARLWLSPAPVWLLDEPYANLDGEGMDLVDRMLAAHLRSGGAAILTCHGEFNRCRLPHQLLQLDHDVPLPPDGNHGAGQ